ncbi:MAG TPA: helix-turn-helix domain-containing protein [Polyangiaceae bacterium]|nr:helix-turn-helix domain-containing protein [Polyangiaceae bacterium]
MQRRIAILIADGFTDSGLSVGLDVFRCANAIAQRSGRLAPFKVTVVSANGGRVRAASGMVVEPTRSLRSAARADVVLAPGFWVEDTAQLDAALERDDMRRLIGALGAAHARGAIVGSSCAGAFLLAEAGVLDGLAATTTWWLAPHLKRRRPKIRVDAARALVVEGRVVSAGAVFAQADLALHLVTRFAGPSLSRRCARLLLLDEHPSQAPYMAIGYLSTTDASVERAEAWIREHLAEDFDVALVARRAGTSPRTLARRLAGAVGLSPIGFVQRLRVEAAVQLLRTTRLSFEEIGRRVGYSDANALRRLIRRETSSTPRELRRVSGGVTAALAE